MAAYTVTPENAADCAAYAADLNHRRAARNILDTFTPGAIVHVWQWREMEEVLADWREGRFCECFRDYDCCTCGSGGCGCSGCFTCNACDYCLDRSR